MFNALNRFISRLDSESPANSSHQRGYGFQVLRNKNPDLAIEPWFDFIVGINGRMIDDSDPNLFAQEVRNCAGSTLTLGLWSAKGQRTRTIHIPLSPSNPSLGVTLQYAPITLTSTIWHILTVPPSSPADTAGLLPYSDYIIGTPSGSLHGESALSELVEEHIGRPLCLFVYNNEYDVTREVIIHPSRDWGGEGALGCTLGFGALHRLPAPLSEPVAGPGETLFAGEDETARFSNEEFRGGAAQDENFFVPAAAVAETTEGDFLVPAQLITPPPPMPVAVGTTKKGKHTHAHGKGSLAKGGDKLMDDYFMEGEKKSRELDHAPSAKASAPPPPKGGGPPRAGSHAPPPKAPLSEKKKGEDEGDDE